jgi:hypothetical protein
MPGEEMLMPVIHGYYGRNPVKWYRVLIWNFDVRVKADTRGAARYQCWLNFHDAYDLTFGEFCKQSRCVLSAGILCREAKRR